jgi:hypothetical protein
MSFRRLWTNIDVLAVFLYKVHCSVWILENKQQYYVQRYVNDTLAPGSPVVNILFDGTGHYDALFLNVILLRQPR